MRRCRMTPASVLLRDFDLCALLEFLDDRGVRERRRIAEGSSFGDVAQEAAHDLTAARFGKLLRKRNVLGARELSQLSADMVAQLVGKLLRSGLRAFERNEGVNSLAGHLVELPTDGGFGDGRMVDERALYLGGRNPMAADVHHVVDAAHEPIVAFGVAMSAVAGKITMRKLRPIGLYVTLVVTPDAAQHAGPRTRQHHVAAAAQRHRVAVVADDVRADAGQRFGGASR